MPHARRRHQTVRNCGLTDLIDYPHAGVQRRGRILKDHLSRKAHATVRTTGDLRSGADRAEVTFRALDAAEIARYVATGEPLDKAGAYAIQGGAAAFVARREGRVDTVVGLPVPLVTALLAALDAPPAPNRSRPPSGGAG